MVAIANLCGKDFKKEECKLYYTKCIKRDTILYKNSIDTYRLARCIKSEKLRSKIK